MSTSGGGYLLAGGAAGLERLQLQARDLAARADPGRESHVFI